MLVHQVSCVHKLLVSSIFIVSNIHCQHKYHLVTQNHPQFHHQSCTKWICEPSSKQSNPFPHLVGTPVVTGFLSVFNNDLHYPTTNVWNLDFFIFNNDLHCNCLSNTWTPLKKAYKPLPFRLLIEFPDLNRNCLKYVSSMTPMTSKREHFLYIVYINLMTIQSLQHHHNNSYTTYNHTMSYFSY